VKSARPKNASVSLMANAAVKIQPESDPVLRAAARARVGAPLTDEERRAKEEGASEPWVGGEEMTAELDRRCAGK
jgi:hypothetical protein